MNKDEMFPTGFFSKKRPVVKKYIELIDKYEIRQSDSGDYNPPSYIWRDNTGELIRCKDCKHWDGNVYYCELLDNSIDWKTDDYCSLAERKEE